MTKKPETDEALRGPEKPIKRRIARLILVPGVAALALWLATSAYLVFNGYYDREVANGVRQVSIPAVRTLAAIQRERRDSINYLSHPARDLQSLLAQRQETDDLVTRLRTAADPVLSKAPRSIDVRWQAFSDRLDRLPGVRSTIDSGRALRQQTTDFYNDLVDSAIDLFDTQARVVPDATATQGGITATDTFRAGDLMSRSSSVISGALGAQSLSQQDHLRFVTMVGAYHTTLETAVPHLEPEARAQYERMTASSEWKALTAAENALISAGSWKGKAPRALQLTGVQWDAAAASVSDQLVALTVTQADRVSIKALRTGNNQLLAAAIGSAVALLIAVGAIVSAVRQSQILVNQALSVRLAQLGKDAVAVVDERLPAIITRLRRREKVDVALELPNRDYGRDEIGHLATVLNKSLHAAVDAAVEEATTRAAGMAMLMGVARRPQRPLQHGLKVIEELQNRIGDEQILAELFDINHQLTQTRRFLENLIILAGGQTGRRFSRPVPVRRVLLGAIAETRQYQRVTLRRTPDVAISGPAVTGITHLLAELLDNALVFSPPDSEVWISCTQAHHGVVIEIEDAGVGMTHEAMEEANTLLATAPTPDLTGLKGGAQIGLWVVAELAKRGGMQVTLRTSAYGGVLAVVLLPATALAAADDVRQPGEPDGDDPRHPAGPGADVSRRPFERDAQLPLEEEPTAAIPARVAMPAAEQPATPLRTRSAPVPVAGATTATTSAAGTAAATGPRAGAAGATGPMAGAAAAHGPGGAPSSNGAGTGRPPLPVRRPQEHLAPQLRDETGGPTQTAAPVYSPEAARNRLASYQKGWRAGRTGEIKPPGPKSAE
ncbi:nitrate- and nitrite sensing domain-containing protein [Couchioplanes caeruleus]|uniref:sensor histidine kinase n=1 Tax=Couchioplanes caeruleus TaxID=56438 RepID=UPI0020C11FCB|nr:nitrate- and nitrite sensing domain-containing protein [Couchioplanes caeruleus]UQU61941.1 nitrate- and nitrite sensing domain-containing protein [Couchioplanes caeruleus]